MTVWPDGQGTWTTGPLELKKITYNIFFEILVLLAIHGRFLSFRFHCLLSAFLCGSNMCTQVSLPVSTFKALCLLLLREQMRYPPSANLSRVQTLFQNCLHTGFWYASTTSYIFNRQSRILFDHNLYSSDVSLGNRGFRSSRTGIIFNRKFPSFKSFIHLKTVRIEMVWGPYIPHNLLNICFESILSLMRHLM